MIIRRNRLGSEAWQRGPGEGQFLGLRLMLPEPVAPESVVGGQVFVDPSQVLILACGLNRAKVEIAPHVG